MYLLTLMPIMKICDHAIAAIEMTAGETLLSTIHYIFLDSVHPANKSLRLCFGDEPRITQKNKWSPILFKGPRYIVLQQPGFDSLVLADLQVLYDYILKLAYTTKSKAVCDTAFKHLLRSKDEVDFFRDNSGFIFALRGLTSDELRQVRDGIYPRPSGDKQEGVCSHVDVFLEEDFSCINYREYKQSCETLKQRLITMGMYQGENSCLTFDDNGKIRGAMEKIIAHYKIPYTVGDNGQLLSMPAARLLGNLSVGTRLRGVLYLSTGICKLFFSSKALAEDMPPLPTLSRVSTKEIEAVKASKLIVQGHASYVRLSPFWSGAEITDLLTACAKRSSALRMSGIKIVAPANKTHKLLQQMFEKFEYVYLFVRKIEFVEKTGDLNIVLGGCKHKCNNCYCSGKCAEQPRRGQWELNEIMSATAIQNAIFAQPFKRIVICGGEPANQIEALTWVFTHMIVPEFPDISRQLVVKTHYSLDTNLMVRGELCELGYYVTLIDKNEHTYRHEGLIDYYMNR